VVAIVGAGGAARSIIDALARAGCAEIVVVNRSAATAQQAATLAGAIGRTGTAADIERADIVVQATSVGMNSDELAFDATLLHAGQTVSDIVYQPLRTAVLNAAAARGAAIHDGLGMLVHQAVHQFRRYTAGVEPDPVAMRAAALAELARR
jgi:shikimate dehydrogenase